MRKTLEKWKERKEMRDEEGFTLIELLIVIIILAILATVVVFAVGTTTKNASLAACKSTVKTVQTALEAYKAQVATGTYPATLTVLVSGSGTRGPWLKALPTATKTKSGYVIAGYKVVATVASYTGYTPASGTFTVVTKGTPKVRTATTSTVCKGA